MAESTGRITKYYRWKCGGKIEHTSSFCNAPNVPDKVLYALTSEVLEKENFTDGEFNEAIEHIEVSKPNTLTFCMKDGRQAVPCSGYVIPSTGELHVIESSWFTSETVIESLRDFIASGIIPDDRTIVMVLDNAPCTRRQSDLLEMNHLKNMRTSG